MSTAFYHWLVMDVIPFVRFTTYYTSFRGWKYHRGYQKLQTGDIIVVIDTKKLTSKIIPGKWTHAGLCVDKGEEWEVSEMTHLNYTKSMFFDMCKEAERVAIYRCRDWDLAYVRDVIVPTCKSFINAAYDVKFTLGVEALYCSELVYESDTEHRLEVSLADLADLGRPYISPTGLTTAKNVDLIWDSANEVSPFVGY
jgi:hypothetical protein